MPMFKRKPTVVEAMQFTDKYKNRVYNWAVQIQGNVTPSWAGEPFNSDACLLIPTREGEMVCDLGDWIVRESHPTQDGSRKLYPVKNEIFQALYEQIDSEDSEPSDPATQALHGNHIGTVYG